MTSALAAAVLDTYRLLVAPRDGALAQTRACDPDAREDRDRAFEAMPNMVCRGIV